MTSAPVYGYGSSSITKRDVPNSLGTEINTIQRFGYPAAPLGLANAKRKDPTPAQWYVDKKDSLPDNTHDYIVFADYGDYPLSTNRMFDGRSNLDEQYWSSRSIKSFKTLQQVNKELQEAWNAIPAGERGLFEPMETDFFSGPGAGRPVPKFTSKSKTLTCLFGIMNRFVYAGICRDPPDQMGIIAVERNGWCKVIDYTGTPKVGDVIYVTIQREEGHPYKFVPVTGRESTRMCSVGAGTDARPYYMLVPAPSFVVGTVRKVIDPLLFTTFRNTARVVSYHTVGAKDETGTVATLEIDLGKAVGPSLLASKVI